MKVRVRLFAVLREAAGTREIELDVPPGATPEDAWRRLAETYPALAARRPNLTAAVNRRYAGFDQPLGEGDELVFVPPVSAHTAWLTTTTAINPTAIRSIIGFMFPLPFRLIRGIRRRSAAPRWRRCQSMRP